MSSIPPPVSNIIGKFCAFELEITPYNIIQECQEYMVTRVYEIIGNDSHTDMLSDFTQDIAPIGDNTNKKQKLA